MAAVVTASVVVMSIVTALSVVFLYRHLQDNLDYQDLSEQLTDRPEKQDVDTGPQEPLNILVMGSDTREGKGNRIDGEAGGGGSDTTILFHLSADREFAYGVSIPRDTLVDRPDCLDKNGDTIPGEEGAQWNTAFDRSAAPPAPCSSSSRSPGSGSTTTSCSTSTASRTWWTRSTASRCAYPTTSRTPSTTSASPPAPARSGARRR